MIDLHSHTTASDGQHAPRTLISMAHAAGVTTLAVTDHDTVSALPACAKACAELGLTLVNGIEVSTFVNRREVHVLGHFVDPAEPTLAAFASRLKVEREERMEQMVEKMRAIGFPITMGHVRALAGPDAHLARPHLARVLVEMNYCANTKEAFDRFLGDGKPGHVERFKLSAEDAVKLIHGAGGTATLAHPGVSKISEYELKTLAGAGLDGVEVEHSDHPPSMRAQLRGWAAALNLVPTAGSDFHGEAVAPGRTLGSTSMAVEQFERLHDKAALYRR
ncbi:MAG: PHP domain-containing protein [Myxococcaceae bacterium]|nr:PHP domain-containing protein [Myxococcaceae bacterium]